MYLTFSELKLVKAALGSHKAELKNYIKWGFLDAPRQLDETESLYNRIDTELRETDIPVETQMYSEDSEGMLWA